MPRAAAHITMTMLTGICLLSAGMALGVWNSLRAQTGRHLSDPVTAASGFLVFGGLLFLLPATWSWLLRLPLALVVALTIEPFVSGGVGGMLAYFVEGLLPAMRRIWAKRKTTK